MIPSAKMNRAERRAAEKRVALESKKYGDELVDITDTLDSVRPQGMIRALRNRRFLVQEYAPADGTDDMVVCRLSINLVSLKGDDWQDGIAWDELQKIKNAAGYADLDAVEVYPPARDLVLAANMRHLWVLRGLLPFAWRRRA